MQWLKHMIYSAKANCFPNWITNTKSLSVLHSREIRKYFSEHKLKWRIKLSWNGPVSQIQLLQMGTLYILTGGEKKAHYYRGLTSHNETLDQRRERKHH
jgi:hypothetical protein